MNKSEFKAMRDSLKIIEDYKKDNPTWRSWPRGVESQIPEIICRILNGIRIVRTKSRNKSITGYVFQDITHDTKMKAVDIRRFIDSNLSTIISIPISLVEKRKTLKILTEKSLEKGHQDAIYIPWDYSRRMKDIDFIVAQSLSTIDIITDAKEVTQHFFKKDDFRLFTVVITKIHESGRITLRESYMMRDPLSEAQAYGKTPILCHKNLLKEIQNKVTKSMKG